MKQTAEQIARRAAEIAALGETGAFHVAAAEAGYTGRDIAKMAEIACLVALNAEINSPAFKEAARSASTLQARRELARQIVARWAAATGRAGRRWTASRRAKRKKVERDLAAATHPL